MAHTKYTGASSGASVVYGALTIPGWREITVEEVGAPVAQTIDTTVAGDSAYQFTEDPLGGQGNPRTEITVEGLLSKEDFTDSDILALTIGSKATMTVQKASGSGKDLLTLTTNARLASRETPKQFGTLVPFTLTFDFKGAVDWGSSV